MFDVRIKVEIYYFLEFIVSGNNFSVSEECAYRLIQNIQADKEANHLSQLVELFEAHRQNSAIVSMFYALFLELARYGSS